MDSAELRARLDAQRRKHRGRGRIIAELIELLDDALATIAAQEREIDRLSRAQARSLVASVSQPVPK